MKEKLAFLILNTPWLSYLVRRYYAFSYYRNGNYAESSARLFSTDTAYQEFYDTELEQLMSGRHNCSDRWEIMKPFFESIDATTVLDIGPATGYFMHALDQETNHQVTGFESSFRYATFLEQTKKQFDLGYQVINGDILEWGKKKHGKYKVVMALSIFHHFLKNQKQFEQLDRLLENLETDYLIFQPHNTDEKQMQNIYREMTSEEFVAYLQEKTELSYSTPLGIEPSNGRTVYVLSRESVSL